MPTISYTDGEILSTPITLTDNSTQLEVDSGTATQSGLISQSGGTFGVEKTGAGTLILTANETYTGTTTISDGALQIGSGTTGGGSLAGDIVDNGALTLFSQGTYAGSITGTGTIKIGDSGTKTNGTVFFTGSSNFNGVTTVSYGNLILAGTAGSLTGDIVIGDPGSTFAEVTIERSNDYVLSADISGFGELDDYGNGGVLTLTGDNSGHTGITYFFGGTLAVGSQSGLGSGLVKMGGPLRFLSSMTSNSNFLVFQNSSFDTFGNNVTLTGTISGNALTKNGAGVLTLAGLVTTNGLSNTEINAGTLALMGSVSIPGLIDLYTSAIFDVSQATGAVVSQLGGVGNVSLGSGTLTITNGMPDGSFSEVTFQDGGIAGGTGGTVVIAGGIYGFDGHFNQTGGTIINPGAQLLLNNGFSSDMLGPGPLIDNGSVGITLFYDMVLSKSISGTGSLSLNNANLISNNDPFHPPPTFTVTSNNTYSGGTSISDNLRVGNGGTTGDLGTGGINNSGSLTFDRSDSITVGGAISGNGSLSIALGSVILTANSSFSGPTTIAAGATLQLGNGGASGSLAGTITDNGTLILDRSDDLSLFVVSGHGNFVKAGSNTVSTSGGLSFGTVTVAAGTLQINYSGSGPLLGSAIIDNAEITLTGNNSLNTIADNISGSGGVHFNGGPVTWLITGNETYTGVTTLSHGALMIGGYSSAGGPTGSITGDIIDGDVTSNVSLAFNRSNDYTYSGNISGLGEVDHDGPGTLTLTGNNTYSGVTFILKGVLQVAGDANLGTGDIRIGSGVLRFLSSTTSTRTYGVSNGTVGSDGSASGAFDTNGFNVTLTGPVHNDLGSTGGLTKIGTGILTLAGSETYVGATYIQGGTLALAGSSNIATSGRVFDNADLDISQTASGTVVQSLGGSGSVHLGGRTLTINQGLGTQTDIIGTPAGILSGAIQDGGIAGGSGGSLVLNGGTEILTGANNYTGTTTIGTGATLQIGNGGAGGSPGSGAVTDNGTLIFNLTSDSSLGPLSGSGGLQKLGSGTLTLTSDNSYGGSTVISGGTLWVGTGGTSGSLGAGSIIDNADLEFDRSDNITLSRVISGTGELGHDGSGVLTITVAQAYTGLTGVDTTSIMALSGTGSIAASRALVDFGTFDISQTGGATLQALTGSASGIVALGGQTLTITNAQNVLFAGTIEDGGIAGGSGGSLVLDGGTLGLSGNNTYTGTTTIASGAVLGIGNAGTTGSLGSGDVIDDGLLTYLLSSPTVLANLVSGTGNLYDAGSGTLTIARVQAYTGRTSINVGATVALSGAGDVSASDFVNDLGGTFDISGANAGISVQALAGSGTVALGSNILTICAGKNYVFSGVIEDGGIAGGSGGGIIVSGGLAGFRGTNTYTGTTVIDPGATLAIGNNTPGGSLGTGAVTDNGTLEYILTSTATVTNAISGTGGFVQWGSGNVILAGVSDYTGATAVNAGTLSVNGSIASSAVTVNSGGKLGGTGAVGAVSVRSGATLAPGNSVGTLSVNGNLSLASGSSYAAEFSAGAADGINVSGSASLSGTLVENFAAGTYAVGTRYTIVNAAGGLSGTFTNIQTTGLSAGRSAVVSYDANHVYVTIRNSVPDDFNGDGESDLVWQNLNGQPAVWMLDGSSTLVTAVVGGPSPGTAWHVIGSGDFNGDGKADILWQNDNGQAAIWLMNGTTPTLTTLVGDNPGTAWHVKGSGDFDGDSHADILWQNDNGQAAIWLMNGTTPALTAPVGGNPGPQWHVIGSGDFNGDGKADILWQNDSGQAAIWLMNGTTPALTAPVGDNPGAAWHVIGAGDFNADGNSDIL
ncbi:MAG TPA: autotransporter-associated beta strand repeat-containing protein, partial [Rhizomicrobium sp.]|nr:autotransporter-associated beta strand repeat-containing protein [Rhizomicrobium sp.]